MAIADLYEYSTPEIVRLMGTRFKDYRMRCGLTQKDERVSPESLNGYCPGNVLLKTSENLR